MRRTKTFLLSVGVALSVAPIFSTALAQQGNSQTRLLLEMQQMRQEIAELRDMVERQQYQIRRMQQAQGSQAPGSSADAGQYGGSTQVGQYPTNRQPSLPQATGQGSYPADGSFPTEGSYQADGSFPAEGSYPTQRSQPGLVTAPRNQVEERLITAPAADDPLGVDNYPPVVDRSIGGDARTVNQFPVYRQPGQVAPGQAAPGTAVPGTAVPGTAVPRQVFNDPTIPRDQVSIPQPERSTGGGIVAIPSTPADPVPGSSAPYQGVPNTASPSGLSTALSEGDYYTQGFDLMKQSKLDEAVEIFKQQLKVYPNGDSADDAHYWIAEAMYVNRKLDVAKDHLQTLIDDYPQSNRVPDAMLKTAYIEQQQGNQIEARILFQEIVNYHPKSDAAIAAKNRLAAND